VFFVGASVGIGHEVLKTVLANFMLENPRVQLQLDLLNRRVDLIEEGFDFLIRIGQLPNSRLIAKHLATIRRKIYVCPDYLSKYGPFNSVEHLNNTDFLLMSSV